ncbi:hypothetical protein J2Z47_001798, partial [Cohnella thailandensis]|nr:hypothetical protein [Cohnella thailandensis]
RFFRASPALSPSASPVARFFRTSPGLSPSASRRCTVFPCISRAFALGEPPLHGFSVHLPRFRPRRAPLHDFSVHLPGFRPRRAPVVRFFRASPALSPSACGRCTIFPCISRAFAPASRRCTVFPCISRAFPKQKSPSPVHFGRYLSVCLIFPIRNYLRAAERSCSSTDISTVRLPIGPW